MQSPAVIEPCVEQATVPTVGWGDTQLAEIPDWMRLAIDESLANRARRDRRDVWDGSLTSDDRLMQPPFLGTSAQSIGLAFESDSDVTWKLGVTKQAANPGIVVWAG